MKKLFIITLMIALLAVPAIAADKSMIGRIYQDGNMSAERLPNDFNWTYGFKIIVYASADDTITVTILAGDGATTVYAGTTTSATSTEVLNMNTVPIPPGSTIAISGVGSGTAVVYFTAAKY
jgi:hypothetical protein